MAMILHKALTFKAFLAAVTVLGTTVALPALAQAQYYGRPIVSERNLLQGLHARGFRRMSPPALNNDVFVLDAIDPRGLPVRLIVSAFNGQIVDAHPQRQAHWTRPGPDSGWDDNDLSERDLRESREWRRDRWNDGRRHGDRWRDRHARLPDQDWQEDTWRGPQVDSDDTPEQTPPRTRSAPERVTVTPLPPLSTAPRDPDIPQPTLKNSTIIKRSPTAIPKDPGEKPQVTPRSPDVSIAPKPKPGMGTRDNPRVIDLTPKVPGTPPAASKSAAPAPPPKIVAKPATNAEIPPPAPLDLPPKVPEPASPVVPPAALE